jgi:hypothetical protein
VGEFFEGLVYALGVHAGYLCGKQASGRAYIIGCAVTISTVNLQHSENEFHWWILSTLGGPLQKPIEGEVAAKSRKDACNAGPLIILLARSLFG